MAKIDTGDVACFIPTRAPMIRGSMTSWFEYGDIGWFEPKMGHLRSGNGLTVTSTGSVNGRPTVWFRDVQVYADDCTLHHASPPCYPDRPASYMPYGA